MGDGWFRREILRLRVLGRINMDESTDDWFADLAAFATAHLAVLADHPWAVVPLFTHLNPRINATIIGEAALEILERAALPAVTR